VITAALFLAALFFSPLVKMISGGYAAGGGLVLYPIVAPALILVGVMMMDSVRQIRWDDFTEAVPAFLTLVTMPLAFSLRTGRLRIHRLRDSETGHRSRGRVDRSYVFAALFVLRYAI
jgi:AGZA family xanthine/uracil permease-like MFS transporter